MVAMAWASCAPEEDPIPVKPKAGNAVPKTAAYDYHLYIENSGSLNGYLNVSGDSSFKSNVYDLIARISNLPSKRSLSLYDVNTVTIPVAVHADAAQVDHYIAHLDAATFKARSMSRKGNQAQSDLGTIIKGLLDSSKSDEVRLLISDGIFSPGRNQDALDYLSRQKSTLHLAIGDKLGKQRFAALVLQFCSGFNGDYYYQDNSSKKGKFEDRPYYIICFGPEGGLQQILSLIRRNHFKGFRNMLFLTDQAQYEVHPSVINYPDYYVYDPEVPLTVRDASAGGKDGHFRLKLGADLSLLPLDDAYLQHKDNYEATNGYRVESIRNSDRQGCTHEFTLEAGAAVPGTLSLLLKRRLPTWVAASNLDSDKGMSAEQLAGKTFGIRYLLEGIYDAYSAQDSNTHFFSIAISVKD